MKTTFTIYHPSTDLQSILDWLTSNVGSELHTGPMNDLLGIWEGTGWKLDEFWKEDGSVYWEVTVYDPKLATLFALSCL